MVEKNRDPFDFGDDPLADTDNLDLSSFEDGKDPLAAYRTTPAQPATAAPTQPVPQSQGQGAGWLDGLEAPAAAAPPAVPSQQMPAATDFPPPSMPPTNPPPGGVPTPGIPSPGTPAPGGPPGIPAPGSGAPQWGAPSDSTLPPSYGVPPTGPPVEPKKGKGCLFWGLIVAFVFALLLGGCGLFVFFTGQGTTETANNFLEAVEAGDFEDAASQANPDCSVSASDVEAELSGMTSHFVVGVGPVAAGEVTVNGSTFQIEIEMRDDQVCTFNLTSG